MRLVSTVVAWAVLVTACSGQGAGSPTAAGGSSATAVAPSVSIRPSPAGASAPATPTPTAAPRCPNPEGGSTNECLGPIPAGTYTTARFWPDLTYTVPPGWSNLEDLAGNFLLLPPGSTLDGVNPGTSDFLGVYRSVGAPERCTGKVSRTVPATTDGLVAYLTGHPQLIVTKPRKATIGGLTGVAVDVAMKRGSGDGCPEGIWVDVYVGRPPTSLVHAAMPDYRLRLYLLRNGDETLAIEIADATGGSDEPDWFASADEVVQTFAFAAT